MLVQSSFHLILNFIGIMFSTNQAHAIPCQVYPSEYAFENDAVTRSEGHSANCRNYPSDHPDGVVVGNHIHCDGTQLKLIDSDLGQEQYSSSKYYIWSAGSDGKLLFIFPTRVSLTTITLHYYSDSLRGLPRLRFYAVPNDFDVWDTPATNYPRVEVASVPPSGQSAGRRNVSININFNTGRVLMYKYSSSLMFAVSEVEFFTCSASSTKTEAITTTSQSTTAATFTSSVTTHLTIPPMVTTTNTGDESYRPQSSSSNQIRSNSAWTRELVAWILVVILAILPLIVSLAINVIQAIWTRRIWRNNNNDTSPECALAMDSNPCYEASNVKPTEAQEAVHVYETVKQHTT